MGGLAERYKGRALRVRPLWRELVTASYVNGRLLGHAPGITPALIIREMEALRGWIDAADARAETEPNAYPPHFYEGKTS
jgi:hypothetical protein